LVGTPPIAALPHIHVTVNKSCLVLIRQARRGFDMDYQVRHAFDNMNNPAL
jgi:tartronate-semialdehyde synthase